MTDWRDLNSRRRAAAKAEGVCVECLVREASPGKAKCLPCRVKISQRRRAARQRPA